METVTKARFYGQSCTSSRDFHCWTATVSSHLEFGGFIPSVDKGRYLDKHALKGAVKLARKGAGVYQPVSPPVARGAVTADVDRGRSRCAACSGWLACVDCITYVRLRQRNAIREHHRQPMHEWDREPSDPRPNPTAIHDRRHDGCPVNTSSNLTAGQQPAQMGGHEYGMFPQSRSLVMEILHRVCIGEMIDPSPNMSGNKTLLTYAPALTARHLGRHIVPMGITPYRELSSLKFSLR